MSARAAAVLLGIVASALLLALVVVVLRQPFAPRSAAPASRVTAAPVSVQPFDDARSVSIELQLGAPVAVRTPVAGTLTATACAPGAKIDSGTGALQVDGRTVLALHGATPWWRDLEVGARGPDVDALQAELRRLGHDTGSDAGTFGSATSSALSAVLEAAGMSRDDPIAAGAVTTSLWLPAPETVVSSCETGLGARVEPGETVFTAAPPVTGARAVVVGPSLERVLLLDGVQLPLLADGSVGVEWLNELAATPSALAAAAEGTRAVQATVRLAQPLDAVAVPPGAIGSDDGMTGCVVADGSPTDVTILGSQLGQTFIAFDSAPPSTVALRAPDVAACD